MQNVYKTNLYKGIAILAFIALVLTAFFYRDVLTLKGTGGAVQRVRDGSDVETMRTASATTTPKGAPTVFLNSGVSSSTLTFESSDLTEFAVELSWFATRTVNSVLQITQYASGNGIDFYPYDYTQFDPTNLSNGELVVAGSTTPGALLWSPGVSNSSSTVVVKLPLISAEKTRLTFGLASSSQGTVMRDSIGFHANVVGEVSGD